MGLLRFLYVVFMVLFVICFLTLAFGFLGVIVSAADSGTVSDAEIAYNTTVVSGGILGTLLAGIGWTLCILAERLGTRGII